MGPDRIEGTEMYRSEAEKTFHEALCVALSEAETAFRKSPAEALRTLHKIKMEDWKQCGEDINNFVASPRLVAYQTVAEDFKTGALEL